MIRWKSEWKIKGEVNEWLEGEVSEWSDGKVNER